MDTWLRFAGRGGWRRGGRGEVEPREKKREGEKRRGGRKGTRMRELEREREREKNLEGAILVCCRASVTQSN